MKPCRKVGLDVTWRCNWHCVHCFYRRNPKLHQAIDTPMPEIEARLEQAQAGGLDHAVMVGYGEPMLCKNTPEIVRMAREMGMAVSMITNGTAGVERYQPLFDDGLDHLHISSHGTGDTLTAITGDRAAFAAQEELKQWLGRKGLSYRMNVAVQQMNYRQLPEICAHEFEAGAWHVVLLGFLPHYEWKDHVTEIAVHPAILRPWLEEAAYLLLNLHVNFSIRYHPFCHIDPSLWPYVTNARHVFMDPFEWNYTLSARDPQAVWRASVECGESFACKEPCRECLAYRHCGGWNRTMAAAFKGADLQPIREMPCEYEQVWAREGGLFDLNPVNSHCGTLREARHEL